MKLVFHVGLHRAASTSMQRWLQEGGEALARRRIFAVPGLSGPDNSSPFACLIGKRFEELGAAAAAQSIERELARLAPAYDIAVISDENLTGLMAGRSPRAFEARHRLADLFALLRKNHAILPVLILRRHGAWLQSCYGVYQMSGGRRDFEQFVANIEPPSLEFSPLVEQLAAAADTVPLIGTLDAIAKDEGREFLGRLVRHLGSDAGLPQTLPKINSSRRFLARAVMQEAARLGAALALGNAKPVRQLIARMSTGASSRGAAKIEELAIAVAGCWVEMPEAVTGPLRRTITVAAAAERQPLPSGVVLENARLAVRRAVASLDRPPAPPQFLAALAERYAADRRRIGERFAPQWLDKEGTAA